MDSKIILVTGASRGIGIQLVKQLSAMNHQVVAISRNVADLNDIASDYPNLFTIHADITLESGIEEIVNFVKQKWGRVDVLIHNAGALLHKPFKDTNLADFQYIYKVNVFAVAELTRKLDAMFIEGSHVVAISSMGGIQGSMKFPGLAAYSSSKGAVITLMELLAEEYKERKVSFNTLALGAVQTEMLKEAFPDYQAPVSAKEMASYISEFALKSAKMFNGKVIQVSSSTP